MNRSVHCLVLVSSCIFAGGCASQHSASTAPSVGRLERLGQHSFNISTRSREAQHDFDRGRLHDFVSEALMRFGRWEEILKEPEPREELHLARALWRFTRAVALNALGRAEEAGAEREAFAKAAAAVPKDSAMGNNSASNLLAIAALVLDGEMAARGNNFDPAIAKLREAVRLEDGLHYDEPPDWIQPVRHTLGAVLMRAGRAAEAEVLYRDDLRKNPENGWALMGLRDALRQQGKEAKAVDKRFRKAWAKADIAPTYTCYCRATKGD